jgi:hypothetical protein
MITLGTIIVLINLKLMFLGYIALLTEFFPSPTQ